MARRTRSRSVLARSLALAGMTLLFVATAAQSQFLGSNLKEANAIAQLLADAETARLNGNCAGRDAKLNEAQTRIAGAIGGVLNHLTEEGQRDFYIRLAEARARPCPPPGSTTPPPPPPVELVPPTGTTPPPDGSIMDEMGESPPPTPPTPPPAPPPLGSEARRIMNQIESDFTGTENARTAGRCTARDDGLNRIGNAIDAWAGSGVIDAGLIDNWRRRLAAARAMPCPPPGAPAPPTQVVPDLRTGDAGTIRNNRGTWAASFSVGYASLEVPVANYGFVSAGPPPEPEVPASLSEQRFGAIAIEGTLEAGRLGVFSIGYAQGDASNHTEIETGPAGSRRGWPFTAISLGGNTGLSGNVEMEVDTEVHVESYRADWNFRFGADPPQEVLDQLRARLNASAGVTVAYTDRDHLGISSITTPVIATQTLEQEVTDLELGVHVGLEAAIPFSADVRMKLGAEAGLSYHDFDLRSVETTAQNFGSAADREALRELRDSIGEITYSGDAIAALELDLSPSAVLFLAGEAAWYSDRARVLNPPNGTFVQNGGTSGLGTDDVIDWSVSIGLQLVWRPSFGQAR